MQTSSISSARVAAAARSGAVRIRAESGGPKGRTGKPAPLPWQSISSSTSLEWIQERLTKLKDILERNSERSGLLLRKLLGPLRLEPTRAGDNDRPFYKATTSLNTLALVDPLTEGEGREGGSNSLQWWSRWDSNPPWVRKQRSFAEQPGLQRY